MASRTSFIKLNGSWNAEPNSPDAVVAVDGSLDFYPNLSQFAEFAEEQRARLRFVNAQRYRLGPTNDDGW